MARTLFYIIRHGQSIGNKNSVILGHTDLGLTELGVLQAERTAEALAEVRFDGIYSSDLSRAYNTALPHAKLRGMEIKTSKGLREMYVGKWENMSKATVRELYGDMYDKGFIDNFGTFRFPDGESTDETSERMYREIEKIALAEQGKTVLLASHAAAIRAFWGKISNITPSELASAIPFPSNASFSIFEYEDGVFKPIEYSVDKHMGELFTTWSR